MRDNSAEILFQLLLFSEGGPSEQFWHGKKCRFFYVVHPAFSLSTTALPIIQGALKDGFKEAVVQCDERKEPAWFVHVTDTLRSLSRGSYSNLIFKDWEPGWLVCKVPNSCDRKVASSSPGISGRIYFFLQS